MAAETGFLTLIYSARNVRRGDGIHPRTHLLIIITLTSLLTAAQASPTLKLAERSGETGTSRSHHRQHRHRHHHKNIGKRCPLGLGGFADGVRHCCKNGGVPIMGRCACPRNFGGDYCELRKRGCVAVPHGGVFTQNCALCTCQYGIVSCITRAFSSCASQEGKEDDDGSMKTYDLRSKKQKEAAVNQLPFLLPKASSGQSWNHHSTPTLVVTFITTLTFLLRDS